MSVAMWNCHTWPLDVSSSVKNLVLRTQCQHWGDISHSLSGYLIQKFWLIFWSWSFHLSSSGVGGWGISDSLSGYLIWKFEFTCDPGHFIWQGMGDISDSLSGYFIWKFELTSHLGCFIWQVMGGISDLVEHFIWKVDLPKWAVTTILHITPDKYDPHSWNFSNNYSSNVRIPSLTTRCQ